MCLNVVILVESSIGYSEGNDVNAGPLSSKARHSEVVEPQALDIHIKMAEDGNEDGSSREQSESSDDSDTQDSDNMPRLDARTPGAARTPSNKLSKKPVDPDRKKRGKAKRACRPCQIAHLTCSEYPL